MDQTVFSVIKFNSFRLKFLLDPWKENIWDPWKDIRNIEKKNQQRTICVFYRSWANFSKTTIGSTRIVLDSNFSKDTWSRNKTRAFDGNLKRILEKTIWVKDYIIFWRLVKILWKDNMDRTVFSFMIFFAVPWF